MRRVFVALLVVAGIAALQADAGAGKSALDAMEIADHVNLEANLRWILERERAAAAAPKSPKGRVAVFADAGVWNLSARSVVQALEREGVPCDVLDAGVLADRIAGHEALVLPGGWGAYEHAAAGEAGRAAIRAFAEKGGTVLGICAGAFLLSKQVAWQGKTYDYGLGLVDCTAEGPLAALAPWPRRADVRLVVPQRGMLRGLAPLKDLDVLYSGGPRLLVNLTTEVFAMYPDGTPAIVRASLGKGQVVLVGPHVERPAPKDGGDDAPAPAASGRVLLSLLDLAK